MQSLLICRTHGLDRATAAEVVAVAEKAGVSHFGSSLDSSAEFFGPDFDPLQAGCVVARLDADAKQPSELLDRLTEQHSPLTVVYLLEKPVTKTIVDAVRKGADDVLDWPSERERLAASIEHALAASVDKQRRLNDAMNAQRRLAELTAGERDVLQLMLSGKVNKSIASRLGIALRTVEARRKRVFTKMGTRSLAEIAAVLHVAGLLFASGMVTLTGIPSPMAH
ncbi:MAG: LuxR C-terminal-related transcriptional regulator [Planctomycetia bacterium]|nr:LuxR C-terminal-related transcriptional regulator [Planctomycetia bacterium]